MRQTAAKWTRTARCAWAVLLLAFLGLTTLRTPVMGQERLPPTQMEDLLQRLDRAEASILQLEAENLILQTQVKENQEPVAEKLEAKADPPAKSPPPKEPPKEEKKEKEEKKWYDKLSLRGYAQFRYNYLTHLEPDSAPPQYAGDSSIEEDQEFLIRRARVILFGDVGDHLYIYLQPDFASTPNGSVDAIYFAQIRDWYGDVYVDTDKVHRFRVGQSKIPYGWENLQSSQNRLPLDRADSFNSAARNERDLGVFYYWTPEWAQETFKYINDEGLKGSGNYGVFGFGAYNGQGGSLRELNDELHLISRLTLPVTMPSGQIVEMAVQGYTGRYVVLGAPISPLGVGPPATPLNTRGRPVSDEGLLDQRLGWTFVYYPQPFGILAEYTIGRGPELNADQTEIERGSLQGGFVTATYRYKTPCHGEFWPYARWQYYQGGYKSAPNAPATHIDEWSLGLEWQIRKEFELACEYLITDRTNLRPFADGLSYEQFAGDILRLQFQVNY